jgi:hypothetical protein
MILLILNFTAQEMTRTWPAYDELLGVTSEPQCHLLQLLHRMQPCGVVSQVLAVNLHLLSQILHHHRDIIISQLETSSSSSSSSCETSDLLSTSYMPSDLLKSGQKQMNSHYKILITNINSSPFKA